MFKKCDLLIYSTIFFIMAMVLNAAMSIKTTAAENVEIYVNNKLQYTFKLSPKKRIIEVPTDIGGVEVLLKDNKVRVTKSYSPKKLCVKQGWIYKSGQTIIGVPDKLLIKITGKQNDDIDFILR